MMNGLIQDVYLPHFYRYGENGLGFLVNSVLSRRCFLSAYNTITPIPNEQKKDLLEYCLEKWPHKDPLEIEECMKVVYTIGTLA